MVEVYMVAHSCRYLFMTFNSKGEAIKFCEDNNWEWLDENEFSWLLEIED